MLTVYVLKTCDTCRKAAKWLGGLDVSYETRDVQADPLSTDEFEILTRAAGWEALLNKSSTTWRSLSDDEKQGLDEKKAVSLLAAHPTLMKRPVFVLNDKIVVGFKQAQQDQVRLLVS